MVIHRKVESRPLLPFAKGGAAAPSTGASGTRDTVCPGGAPAAPEVEAEAGAVAPATGASGSRDTVCPGGARSAAEVEAEAIAEPAPPVPEAAPSSAAASSSTAVPPPPPAPPVRRRGAAYRGSWERVQVIKDGVLYGEVVYDPVSKKMNAHCEAHEIPEICQSCHFDKLLTPYRATEYITKGGEVKERALAPKQKGQGRPVGLLIAWLLQGPDCDDKDTHQRRKAALGTPAQRHLRVAARNWAKQQPELRPLFDLERERRDGEESEPEAIG